MATTSSTTGGNGASVRLTPDGYRQLVERVAEIRDRRLPQMRPLMVETERDERVVAEFERLIEEADGLDALLASAEVIEIDPADDDGRVRLGMRVKVTMADGSQEWVRPVHPEEAYLDDERISSLSPLAVAIIGARPGHTVWVDAPSGAWSCKVLATDLAGVATG